MNYFDMCVTAESLGTDVLDAETGAPATCGQGKFVKTLSEDQLFNSIVVGYFQRNPTMKAEFATLIEVPTKMDLAPDPVQLGQVWMLGFCTVLSVWAFALGIGKVLKTIGRTR